MVAFLTKDVSGILHNKFIVVIGDSIQRGIYKDLVLLLHDDRYLSEQELKNKGEYNFMSDDLIEGGRKGEMCNGISYKEVRQYQTDNHLIRFYFITRCYNNYMESIISDLTKEPHPDIIIMNSCLWDITRYGKDAINEYKENLDKVFERFSQSLPKHCLVLWNTTLPISSSAKGGFLIPEIEFMTSTLRLDIMEANYFARNVAIKYGYDVLDLHFYLRHHLQRRVGDGIHWDMLAHRYISNLILNHICSAWNLTEQQKVVLFEDKSKAHGGARKDRQYSPVKRNHVNPLMSISTYQPQNFQINFQRRNDHQGNGFSFNVGSSYTWQPYGQDARAGRVMRENNFRHQPYRQNHYYHY